MGEFSKEDILVYMIIDYMAKAASLRTSEKDMSDLYVEIALAAAKILIDLGYVPIGTQECTSN